MALHGFQIPDHPRPEPEADDQSRQTRTTSPEGYIPEQVEGMHIPSQGEK
jgi:hypothetical protein